MMDTLFTRPHSLFDQLDAMQRLLSRSLGGDAAPGGIRSVGYGEFPDINVGRTPGSIEVFAFAPGMDPASLDVTIERNLLKISGERAPGIPRPDDRARIQAYANERPAGRFSRAVSLPDDVDPTRVEAKYRDGILRVSIALNAAAQPQRIAVQ